MLAADVLKANFARTKGGRISSFAEGDILSYLVGIDGGGTKTAFLLYSLSDGRIKKAISSSICPQDWGLEALSSIGSTVSELTGEGTGSVLAICAGIPCHGEDEETDAAVAERLKAQFPNSRILCVNDCAVGYAGALDLQPGINIVAGTGAIAYGENAEGVSARSSVWSGEFADEGSCSWLGRRCLELFCKQADGRLPKAALYSLVKQKLELKNDFDIIKIYETRLKNSRREMAALQMLLHDAALGGDGSALAAYGMAADELAMSVEAVRRALGLSDTVTVSYAGGLFKTEELIINSLKAGLARLHSGYRLQKPVFTPEEGALLMAAKAADCDLTAVKQKISEMER